MEVSVHSLALIGPNKSISHSSADKQQPFVGLSLPSLVPPLCICASLHVFVCVPVLSIGAEMLQAWNENDGTTWALVKWSGREKKKRLSGRMWTWAQARQGSFLLPYSSQITEISPVRVQFFPFPTVSLPASTSGSAVPSRIVMRLYRCADKEPMRRVRTGIYPLLFIQVTFMHRNKDIQWTARFCLFLFFFAAQRSKSAKTFLLLANSLLT